MRMLQIKWSENGQLGLLYILGARAFAAFADLVFDGVAIVEGVPVGFGMMHEKIIAAFTLLNEAVALFRIKPLYCSFWHLYVCFLCF